ncbi:MAG: FKBP-type peptidyl-prolyl cis-trans isomerase [Candidatus Heimdallarchaeota archaeon]|nr:FKBP-type peptidyl-prolyl cis-trans isomerase [Candidatus Heimdallarchaeota archaeon]
MVNLKPKNALLILIVLFFLTIPSIQTNAYTNELGIERGDVVEMELFGTKQSDGSVFQPQSTSSFEIDPIGLITGFYTEVIGMKVGETKEFSVAPSDGYTDPEHKLYGETLLFEVFIIAIKDNIRSETDANGDDEGSGTFSRFLDIGLKITGGLFVIGALVYFWNAGNVRTTPKCVHCASIGRSKYAEGKCKKCGNAYCRASFSRGCPNCKANSFIQLKG